MRSVRICFLFAVFVLLTQKIQCQKDERLDTHALGLMGAFFSQENMHPKNSDNDNEGEYQESVAIAEDDQVGHDSGANEHQPPEIPKVQDMPENEIKTDLATEPQPVLESESKATTIAQATCQFDELINCLTDPLIEWAIEMRSLKERLLANSSAKCLGAREIIRECIEEKAPEYQCNHTNVFDAIARITNQVRARDTDDFLLGYYLTAYVCTKEGADLRDQISTESCLKEKNLENIAFGTLQNMDAVLSSNHSMNESDRCQYFKNETIYLRVLTATKCLFSQPHEASVLMCESIKMAILKMHPEMFNGEDKCEFQCDDEKPPSNAGGTAVYFGQINFFLFFTLATMAAFGRF